MKDSQLTIEEVKELINDPSISDEEVTEIRDSCMNLAEIIFEQWNEERKLQVTEPKGNGIKQPRHEEIIPQV
jgi:hypothetical protein